MDKKKQKILIKVFIILQISYFLLMWMFHNRNTKDRANKIDKRALQLVHDDNTSLIFDELLTKHKSFSIYQRNLQLLATKIFEVSNGRSTALTEKNFQLLNKPYDLRNNSKLLTKIRRILFTEQKSY